MRVATWCIRHVLEVPVGSEVDSIDHRSVSESGKGGLPQTLEQLVVPPSVLTLEHHLIYTCIDCPGTKNSMGENMWSHTSASNANAWGRPEAKPTFGSAPNGRSSALPFRQDRPASDPHSDPSAPIFPIYSSYRKHVPPLTC